MGMLTIDELKGLLTELCRYVEMRENCGPLPLKATFEGIAETRHKIVSAYSEALGRVEQLEEQVSRCNQAPSRNPDPSSRVLEIFNGVLDDIDDEIAHVLITSKSNGDKLRGEYPLQEFKSKGIEKGDRFILKTVGSSEAIRIEIEALSSTELTEQDLRDIDERIFRVISREDPGIQY